MLRIEALQAGQGDALIVHFGDPDDPMRIVIDGGAQKTVRAHPFITRLAELSKAYKERDGQEARLPIEVMVATHIDNDHLNGLLALCEVMTADAAGPDTPALDVKTLWLNGLDDLPAPSSEAVAEAERLKQKVREKAEAGGREAKAGGEDAALDRSAEDTRSVVEGVPDARDLLSVASGEPLSWAHNAPFDKAVRGDGVPSEITYGELKLTVLTPTEPRLQALADYWIKDPSSISQALELDPREVLSLVEQEQPGGDFEPDTTVTNPASIAFLLESDERKVLMTGDAQGDDVLEAIRDRGWLNNGQLWLDLLKLPHHGSDHNSSLQFLTALPARHYLISADGQDENPDLKTVQRLLAAREDNDFTVHLTNRHYKPGRDAGLNALISAQAERGFELCFRDDDSLSLTVELA